ncbi:MAG TPA: anti-sigma factor [Flavipsychrobacter sp.]|nr:anti-sigma factor [Flavipsychrobacter sp.]
MNLKEYIESGLLEAYVLGALSAEDQLRIEKDIAQYPELKAEIAIIEETMYRYSKAHAIAPPEGMKEKIKAQLDIQNLEAPVSASSPIREFRPAAGSPASGNWQRAAMWILLVTTGLLATLLFQQRNSLRNEILTQNKKIDSLIATQTEMAALLDDKRKESAMVADTAMHAIVMKAIQPQHAMAATVYWNKTQGDVYLSFTKMPLPPQGKQYQLWMIRDGKPVSMGMVPNELLAKGMMMKVPSKVVESQAFAISLENEGGNATPTEVQVLGTVS